MKTFLSSLTIKIGISIILAEALALSIAGVIYISRFSDAVDARIEQQLQSPGILMNAGVLNPATINDSNLMRDIIGEELIDAFVVGVANNNIFYSMNPSSIGKSIADVGVSPDLFHGETVSGEPQSITEDGKNYLISVSPIAAVQGQAPFLYIYIKVGTTAADAEKAQITQFFVIVSTAILIFTSFVIILSFNQIIRKRISRLVAVLRRVEAGELSARLPDVPVKDEIDTLQHGVNSMAAQLEELVRTLEQRVASRTRDLQVAADVSREVTNVLNLEELLPKLSELTFSGFNLYSVGVFLFDEQREVLELAASTGETGREMLQKGRHFMLQDQGLVPRAARLREAQIINDVASSQDHVFNPLLPDTQAEINHPYDLSQQFDRCSRLAVKASWTLPGRRHKNSVNAFRADRDCCGERQVVHGESCRFS